MESLFGQLAGFFSRTCLFTSRATYLSSHNGVCLCTCGQEVTSSRGHHKRTHHGDIAGSAWGQHKIRSLEQSYEC